MKRLLALALLLLPSLASAGEITLKRGDTVYPPITIPDEPVAAGHAIRSAIDLLRPIIQPTDVLICNGEADFGHLYAFHLPQCTYRGPATWLTHCKIDPTNGPDNKPTKGSATPGFVATTARFEKFKLAGPCAYPSQDGSIIGWQGENDADGKLEFVDCELDGMGSEDWLIYTWESKAKREIILDGCAVKYCRFGIAAAASGNPTQIVTCTNTDFIGDARGSRSTGASSGGDSSATNLDRDVNGGVCTAILNRAGTVTCKNCTFQTIGLEKEYYDSRPDATYQRWGCSRLANWGTDQYSSRPAQTTWVFEKCRSLGITPGISRVWNDVDVRGNRASVTITGDPDAVKAAQQAGAKLVTEANEKALDLYRAARGGSGSGGEVLQYKAPGEGK